MKVVHITVRNFRSVSEAEISNCGGFNVIIGKNNAGKSTLLLALSAFFNSLHQGRAVCVKPMIGQPYDFHEAARDKGIELVVTLSLSVEERGTLDQAIASETPQVKNALGTIPPDANLEVVVRIEPSVRPYSYVQRIRFLVDSGGGRKVLEVSAAAAAELADMTRRAEARETEAEQLSEILSRVADLDAEDWTRLKGEGGGPWRYVLRPSLRGQPSLVEDRIDTILRSSDSPSAFKDALRSAIAAARQDAKEIPHGKLSVPLDTFAGQETTVPNYAVTLIGMLGRQRVEYFTERRSPIGRVEAEQLLELKVTRGGPEKLRVIQETVATLLGVEIDAFRAERARGEPAAELDVDRFLIQVNGAGIREALRLILDYELKHPQLLLVEEPEMHLHAALETSMMRYLQRIGGECQVFITTHSTNFLDASNMRHVYLTSKEPSTKVQEIGLDEAEGQLPRELGIRLSSLFLYDRLVFVEGASDVEVLREIASLTEVNLATAGVGFIAMGGARNLAHFGAEATIGFLSRRQVRMWFVIDRDERSEHESRQLVERLGGRASVKVLERRELENYLLCPRAVAEFICLKRRMQGLGCEKVSGEAVEAAMTECASELRSEAVERRIVKRMCGPIHFDRKAVLDGTEGDALEERVRGELSRQQERLGQIIATVGVEIGAERRRLEETGPEELRKIVPGDLLLDAVCRRFEARFIKSSDSLRLAACHRQEEVPEELRELVRDMGRVEIG